MHDDSCIGINCAHKLPKCFRSLHTLLGFSLCTSRHQFNCCRCTNLLNFWPVREFLVEIHTAEMDLWGVIFNVRRWYRSCSTVTTETKFSMVHQIVFHLDTLWVSRTRHAWEWPSSLPGHSNDSTDFKNLPSDTYMDSRQAPSCDFCLWIWDQSTAGGLNVQNFVWITYCFLVSCGQKGSSHQSSRSITVDDVHAVLVCNALLFTVARRDTTAEEVCFVDLFLRVSYYVEELSVEFVRLVSCMLPSLLSPLCTSLTIRCWVRIPCVFFFFPPVWMTLRGGSLFPEFCSCHNLTWESYAWLFCRELWFELWFEISAASCWQSGQSPWLADSRSAFQRTFSEASGFFTLRLNCNILNSDRRPFLWRSLFPLPCLWGRTERSSPSGTYGQSSRAWGANVQTAILVVTLWGVRFRCYVAGNVWCLCVCVCGRK